MRTMFISREDAATSISLYAMRHCMTELTNNNEFLDPVFVSYNLDVTDKDSKPFLYTVAAIITDAVLIPEADKKKSTSPPTPTGTVNAAPAAPEASTEASAQAPTSSSKD